MAKLTFKEFLEAVENDDPRVVPKIKTKDIRTRTDPRLDPDYEKNKAMRDKQFKDDPNNSTAAADKLKSLFRKPGSTGKGSHSATVASAVGVYPA